MRIKNLILKMIMLVITAAIASSIFTGYDAKAQAASKKPARVTVKKAASPSAGTIKVTWKKVSKASKYQVQAAVNKKFSKGKLTRTAASKKSSITISKLTQGRKYYVRVRAYRTVKGKKYYGKWSKRKTVTVKKKKPQESGNKPEEKPSKPENNPDNKPEEDDNDDYKGETDLSVLRSKNELSVGVYSPRNSLEDSDVYPYKYLYTGTEIKPKVQKVEIDSRNYYLMVEGTDYTVSYKDNVNPGTAKFIITGIGRFHGSVSYDFIIVSKEAIRKELSECIGTTYFLGDFYYPASSLPVYIFTGEEIKPKMLISEYYGRPLIQGIDYELSYTDNVNLGTATIIITGIGRYKGSVTGHFAIMSEDVAKKELSSYAHVTFLQDSSSQPYIYTGEEIKPEVKVWVYSSDGKSELVYGTDYELSYADNINPGTASVTVTGIGEYKGSITGNFTIVKARQDVTVELDSNVLYLGESRTIHFTGKYYGDAVFTASEEGIVKIDHDGTITGLREGVTRLSVNISGDIGHESYQAQLGRITVLDETAVVYGFHRPGAWEMASSKVAKLDAANSDGTQTYKIEFDCSLDQRWLDHNVAFEAEDMTPPAYARMFEDLEVPYAAPELTLTDTDGKDGIDPPFHEGGFTGSGEDWLYTSGKMITINTGPGIRAVKVTAKKGDEVLDTVYLLSTGKDKDGNTTEFDKNLFRRVRQCVEASLWTEDMTNLEKIGALADYIGKTAHYPDSLVTNKEYNPAFWDDWSVDGVFLSGSYLPLDCATILQGGMAHCWAAEVLMYAAVEDLGMKALSIDNESNTVEPGEGVYLSKGAASSNPTVSFHWSFTYKDADEKTVFIDAQGLGAYFKPSDSNITCEAHGCKSNIIPLKPKPGEDQPGKPQVKLEIQDPPETVGQGTAFTLTANRKIKAWEVSNERAYHMDADLSADKAQFLAAEAGAVTIKAVSEDGQEAECSVIVTTSGEWISGEWTVFSDSQYDSASGTAQITDFECVMGDSVSIDVLSDMDTEKFELQYSKNPEFHDKFLSKTTFTGLEPVSSGFVLMMGYLEENCNWYFRCRPYRIADGQKIYGNWGETKMIRIPRYSAESGQPVKYSYSVHVLNPGNVYEDANVVVYVKTDNPQPDSISILCDQVTCVRDYTFIAKDGTAGNKYWDIDYKSDQDLTHMIRRVEGGYVLNLALKAGTKKITLREFSEEGYADMELFSIDVLDYETERGKWIDSLIAEYTTEDMTPVEKMDAICKYLKEAFVYSPVVPYKDGYMYINVLSGTVPPFERFYWDSAESPTMLKEIAGRLGFENIVRLTGEEHAWITADYDGETYQYGVCPPTFTGIVEEITYIDFSKYD